MFDILVRIFEHVLRDHAIGSDSYYETTSALAALARQRYRVLNKLRLVCAAWCDVVMGSSTLWELQIFNRASADARICQYISVSTGIPVILYMEYCSSTMIRTFRRYSFKPVRELHMHLSPICPLSELRYLPFKGDNLDLISISRTGQVDIMVDGAPSADPPS